MRINSRAIPPTFVPSHSYGLVMKSRISGDTLYLSYQVDVTGKLIIEVEATSYCACVCHGGGAIVYVRDIDSDRLGADKATTVGRLS